MIQPKACPSERGPDRRSSNDVESSMVEVCVATGANEQRHEYRCEGQIPDSSTQSKKVSNDGYCYVRPDPGMLI